MQRKTRKPRLKIPESMQEDGFLRSINIEYDAPYPERVRHFQPTAKSIPLLRALFGLEKERAFLINAPYGSGKSLTATYLLQMVENRPDSKPVLKEIENKFKAVSPEFAEISLNRRRKRTVSGLVIALEGYQAALPKSIKDAALASFARMKLGREARPLKEMPCRDIKETIKFLGALTARAEEIGHDRIVIIWDEFGRHIEGLLAGGRPSDLSDIQKLAEYVSRSSDFSISLGLILHQGLLRYAGNLPQSVRAEWTKIEGRFQTIQYIDDSKEMYRLIGELQAGRRQGVSMPTKKAFADAAGQAKKQGLFSEIGKGELAEILERSYPIEPVTLYLLPRLSARVAQNERTTFGFLHWAELVNPTGPGELFDYFTAAMQADTAVGGTYKQWIETRSALSKVKGDADDEKALKTACLLGLGTSGERSKASRDLLELALRGYSATNGEKKVVADLIARKLILHRKHSGQVSVWHGTDMDLKGRLEEEKARRQEHFQIEEFLETETPAPAWRPVLYNSDYGIRRYFAGEYRRVDGRGDKNWLIDIPLKKVPDSDGRIVYLLAETRDDVMRLEAFASSEIKDKLKLFAIPRSPVPLREAALEVYCLLQMQRDVELVGEDPMVLPELQQMTDDARNHLSRLMDRIVLPTAEGPRWFYRGEELSVSSSAVLRRQLSKITAKVFSATPRINNEMIVRKKPSAIIVNARKKLLMGILDRSGQENLGIIGNFPDSSMFRCVLKNTGIYREDKGGQWRWAKPEEVEDKGLQKVWELIGDFFTIPSERPKYPADLFGVLQSEPIGLRQGLLPILFSAGLKAFPSTRSLLKDGKYLADILPSDIEQLCKAPEKYTLQVMEIKPATVRYLKELLACFSGEDEKRIRRDDLLRSCNDAIERWKAELPVAALSSKQLSPSAHRFQTLLRRDSDPVRFLLTEIPDACEISVSKPKVLMVQISSCKAELESVTQRYFERAALILRRAWAFGMNDKSAPLIMLAARWTACFGHEFSKEIIDRTARGFISRLKMEYDTDRKLVDSVSDVLIQKPLSRWDDYSMASFDTQVHSVINQVEDAAMRSETSFAQNPEVSETVTQLVHVRISELYDRLVTVAGDERAKLLVADILQRPPVKKAES